jgi:predicted metal-dependent phosphoesterase TrpH
MIDLHAHTTASDGTLSPTQLVHLARDRGLAALAVTDHDTVGGLGEATTAAGACGIELVPGIELSVDYPHGELHLLGYYLDFRDRAFLEQLETIQENRTNRNGVMLRKIREHGFDLTREEVEAEAGGGQIGRPHFARALIRKGYAASVPDAFERFLGPGRPLHVPKVRLDPEAAIRLVHAAGGLAVLAHPKYLQLPSEVSLVGELTRLQALGLDGVECYYRMHTLAETERYLEIARRLGLLVTAGSDFHGPFGEELVLGLIYQGRAGDDSLLAALKQAVKRS